MHDTIAVLDFGSQYNQLIVRRIREFGVYAKLFHHATPLSNFMDETIKGIVLSGSPQSVSDVNARGADRALWNEITVPILGICYGMQYMVHEYGGTVSSNHVQEYGRATITISAESALFSDVPNVNQVWMSHGDSVVSIPEGWNVLARSETCAYAGVSSSDNRLHGIQFHPEVTHTHHGMRILQNFVMNICGARATWDMEHYLHDQIKAITNIVGDKSVICGLSGGVDSAVTAALLEKAIGDKLHCIFVDHGLLRKGEREEVKKLFSGSFRGVLHIVDASHIFLDKLIDVSNPEKKRKIIGHTFIEVFQAHADTIKNADFLAQGTLYTDKVESGHGGVSQTIKSHHNVGGLPKDMHFSLIEPLASLYKDEVRALGLKLGLPEALVYRQPFPGPGLAVRIIGPVTKEKVIIVRESDAIVCEEIMRAGLDKKIWQYFTVLVGISTVGIKGDARVYGDTIAIRAVSAVDGMTASPFPIPFAVLEKMSSRIVNEISNINRVVYDVTAKPPGTIEWE